MSQAQEYLVELKNVQREVDIDSKLICWVKDYPILYDAQWEFSGNRNKKSKNTWSKIAKSLNLDVPTTRARWQELIDNFIREYKFKDFPPLETTLCMPDGQIKKFKYYNKMRWLIPYTCFCSDGKSASAVEIDSSDVFWAALEHSTPTGDKPSHEQNCGMGPGQENKSDHHFMASVMEDLTNLSPKTKFQFKKGVLELLEKCVLGDK